MSALLQSQAPSSQMRVSIDKGPKTGPIYYDPHHKDPRKGNPKSWKTPDSPKSFCEPNTPNPWLSLVLHGDSGICSKMQGSIIL